MPSEPEIRKELQRCRSLAPSLAPEEWDRRVEPLVAEIKLRWSYMSPERFVEIVGLALNDAKRIPTWADLRDVDRRTRKEKEDRERERLDAERFAVPLRIKREREILEGAKIAIAELPPAELAILKAAAESELRSLCGSASDRYVDHILATQIQNQIESVYARERIGKNLLAPALDGLPSQSCECQDCRRRFAGVIPFTPLSDRQRGALAAAGIALDPPQPPAPKTAPTSAKHATSFGDAMEEPPPPADWRKAADDDVGF